MVPQNGYAFNRTKRTHHFGDVGELVPSKTNQDGKLGDVTRHCNLRVAYMKQDHLKTLGPYFDSWQQNHVCWRSLKKKKTAHFFKTILGLRTPHLSTTSLSASRMAMTRTKKWPADGIATTRFQTSSGGKQCLCVRHFRQTSRLLLLISPCSTDNPHGFDGKSSRFSWSFASLLAWFDCTWVERPASDNIIRWLNTHFPWLFGDAYENNKQQAIPNSPSRSQQISRWSLRSESKSHIKISLNVLIKHILI